MNDATLAADLRQMAESNGALVPAEVDKILRAADKLTGGTKGRTKKAPRVTTAVRLDPELHEQMKKAAAERGMPMNTLVVRMCEYGTTRLLDAPVLFAGEADEA